MTWPEWEGVAACFLEESRIAAPVDPWLLAWALDLEVRTAPPGLSFLDEDRGIVYVDPSDRLERQGFGVAHECAHTLLFDHGLPDSEYAANSLANCLLLPRAAVLRDVQRTGGCLYELRRLHPWASHETIARRRVSLEPSVAWVWDALSPVPRRYPVVTPGVRWPHDRPTGPEIDALRRALVSGKPAESTSGVRAWPITEQGYVRIISIAPLDALQRWA